MNQESYIEAFHAWIRRNDVRLSASGITVQVPEKILLSGTHADFLSKFAEATVEVWDYGFSEFHVLDLQPADREPDYQVKVTHYEFQNEGEMFRALTELIEWMSRARKAEAADKAPAVAGRA